MEKSAEQVWLRANRLGHIEESVLIFPQTQVPAVLDAFKAEQPGLVVVDSVQTLDFLIKMVFQVPSDKSESAAA